MTSASSSTTCSPPRLFVLTVHHRSDEWIEPQLRFLKKFTPNAITVAYVDHDLDAKSNDSKFDHNFLVPPDLVEQVEQVNQHLRITGPTTYTEHSLLLDDLVNQLEQVVKPPLHAMDRLLFLDPDAFPIADLTPVLDQLDRPHPIVGIVRCENGDYFPHPCFSVTTFGFRKTQDLSWRQMTWLDNDALLARSTLYDGQCASVQPMTNDTGSVLFYHLLQHGLSWAPLLRTNTREEGDGLLFGVYEHCIYHHGAGTRDPVTRLGLKKGINVAEMTRISSEIKAEIYHFDSAESLSLLRRFAGPVWP